MRSSTSDMTSVFVTDDLSRQGTHGGGRGAGVGRDTSRCTVRTDLQK
jgi:hypothetical protein